MLRITILKESNNNGEGEMRRRGGNCHCCCSFGSHCAAAGSDCWFIVITVEHKHTCIFFGGLPWTSTWQTHLTFVSFFDRQSANTANSCHSHMWRGAWHSHTHTHRGSVWAAGFIFYASAEAPLVPKSCVTVPGHRHSSRLTRGAVAEWARERERGLCSERG